jgi:hypothetical protein
MDSRPPRIAAITSALRRMTQRLVPGAGKSVIVKGLPPGPITYLGLGRTGTVMKAFTQTTEQLGIMLRAFGYNSLKEKSQAHKRMVSLR